MIQGQIMNIFVSIAGVPNGKRRMWEIAVLSAITRIGVHIIFFPTDMYGLIVWWNIWVHLCVLFLGDEGLILLCVVILISIFFPYRNWILQTLSQKDLYLFFATLRIYIFVTNNNLVIGDWCEVWIALIGHFQISHMLASQTCWVNSVHWLSHWIQSGNLVKMLLMRRNLGPIRQLSLGQVKPGLASVSLPKF